MESHKPFWVLTKLGDNGMPVICSSQHPDRTPEKYDISIGQACVEKNWLSGNIIDIAEKVSLSEGWHIFAFADWLEGMGVSL